MTYLIVVVYKNEGKPSDWIINPTARLAFYKVFIYIAFILSLFNIIAIQVFNSGLFVLNSIITLHAVYYYLKFTKKHEGFSKGL